MFSSLNDSHVDEDDCNKCQRFAGSLDKGYHRAELMVYTGRHAGDIFDWL